MDLPCHGARIRGSGLWGQTPPLAVAQAHALAQEFGLPLAGALPVDTVMAPWELEVAIPGLSQPTISALDKEAPLTGANEGIATSGRFGCAMHGNTDDALRGMAEPVDGYMRGAARIPTWPPPCVIWGVECWYMSCVPITDITEQLSTCNLASR